MDRIQNYETMDWSSGEIKEQSLLADVIAQVKMSGAKKVLCNYDTFGGDANVGLGVYNYLKQSGLKVESKILNSCGSIATVMAFSGDTGKITMPKHGLYVIHQASNAAWGTAKDLRAAADVAEKYTDTILDIYASNNRVGKTKDELAALIADGDYWMTGEEAKAMGFVDDCYNDDSVTVTNCIEIAKQAGQNIPQRILDMQVTNEVTTLEKLNNSFMDLKNFVTAAIDKIKGNKVDKNSANITNDIAEAIAPSLIELTDGITAEVTAELGKVDTKITTATEKVTADVTAAMETKYATVIADLTAKIEALTADIADNKGKQTTGATTTSAEATKMLVGKFV
jgi:ATP-dependent protease ClpP protease subunit